MLKQMIISLTSVTKSEFMLWKTWQVQGFFSSSKLCLGQMIRPISVGLRIAQHNCTGFGSLVLPFISYVALGSLLISLRIRLFIYKNNTGTVTVINNAHVLHMQVISNIISINCQAERNKVRWLKRTEWHVL